MVVRTEYQRLGLGKGLVQGLTEAALERGASSLILNARITKMQFYQKCGFSPVGEIFASSKTGVPHIKMHKEIGK